MAVPVETQHFASPTDNLFLKYFLDDMIYLRDAKYRVSTAGNLFSKLS